MAVVTPERVGSLELGFMEGGAVRVQFLRGTRGFDSQNPDRARAPLRGNLPRARGSGRQEKHLVHY